MIHHLSPPRKAPVRILKAWFPFKAATLRCLRSLVSATLMPCFLRNTFLTGRVLRGRKHADSLHSPHGPLSSNRPGLAAVRYQHEAHRGAFLTEDQPLLRGWRARLALAELRVLLRCPQLLSLEPLAAVTVILQQEKDDGHKKDESCTAVIAGCPGKVVSD